MTAIAQTYLRSTRSAERETAAAYLVNTFLDRNTSRDERHAAESALTMLADDPSPKVRLAIATTFAGSARAPLHIVLHLARDQHIVAAPLLLRSPVLGEGDLIELAATLDAKGQSNIARRPGLTAAIAAVISELGALEAVIELSRNDDADILPSSYRRMVDRFGTNAQLREILIREPRLPVDCRHRLLASLGDILRQSSFVQAFIGTDRAAKVTRDACARSSVALIDAARPGELAMLVARLRESGDLTTSFVLRCMALGKVEFFVHLVAHLASVSPDRVRTILVSGRDLAIVALFDKANLSPSINAPLLSAIHLWRAVARGAAIAGPREASRLMIEAVEEGADMKGSTAILSLLRQIHADATRLANVGGSRLAA